jgi:hypothetical protein
MYRDHQLWHFLFQNWGWIAIILLCLLLPVREGCHIAAKRLGKFFSDGLYRKLAGTIYLRWLALRRYRSSLKNTYEKLHVPFRPNKPMDLSRVFVPLKLAGLSTKTCEAFEAIAQYGKIVIHGAPGAGKSTLLKRIALSYGEGRPLSHQRTLVPVLVQLSRLSDPAISLESSLEESFLQNCFPDAKEFVASGLAKGQFLVLLDGLDEVSGTERSRVVEQIRNFASRYPRCGLVVICRTAVYRGQLDDVAERVLEVAEFNDKQMRRFLVAWNLDTGEPDKSVDQLLQTLRDRPQIMQLARNPLMLTIIAYLYTDTDLILPHSRAEFYRKSTDLLLEFWAERHNHYPGRAKRHILRTLALFLQRSQEHDRRSMDFASVLKSIQEIAPSLGLDARSDSTPLLDEIVERSGLLLSIDRGERYQFAHLTVQEYFAADALTDAPDNLLSQFRADPDGWREVVKLWCGLSIDSTRVIESIWSDSRILAFECLADAQVVSAELGDTIMSYFRSLLLEGRVDEPTERALAAVASHPGPRGNMMLQFLEKTLTSSDAETAHLAAANALALTNLPRAASTLAQHYQSAGYVRSALVRMGDLAVRPLGQLAAQGSVSCVDALAEIGTPQAFETLMELLLFPSKSTLQVRSRAALHIGSHFSDNEVAEMLSRTTEGIPAAQSGEDEWIVEPFRQHPALQMPATSNVIVKQLPRSPSDINEFKSRIDPRLAVAAMIRTQDAAMLNYAPPVTVAQLERQIAQTRFPTQTDWQKMFEPLDYDFDDSWHLRSIRVLAMVPFALVALAMFHVAATPGYWIMALLAIPIPFITLVVPTVWLRYLACPFTTIDKENVVYEALLRVCGATLPMIAAFVCSFWLRWYQTVPLVMLVYSCCSALWTFGRRKQIQKTNPLHGLFGEQASPN